MSKLLELQNAWKEYRNGSNTVVALQGISFAVEEWGRITVVLGPSGRSAWSHNARWTLSR